MMVGAPNYDDQNYLAAETAKGLRRWVEYHNAPSGVVPIGLLERAAAHIERLIEETKQKESSE